MPIDMKFRMGVGGDHIDIDIELLYLFRQYLIVPAHNEHHVMPLFLLNIVQ
jgi:hypothetical protein